MAGYVRVRSQGVGVVVAVVVVVELLLCAALAVLLPAPYGPAAAGVLAVVAAALLSVRGAREALGSVLSRSGRRRSTTSVDVVDLVAPDGSFVGCVDRSPIVATALELGSGTPVSTTIGRDGPSSYTGARVPLAAICSLIDQGGTRLAGVDVCVRGRRSGPGPTGAVYDRLVGPLPVVSHRTVILVLRFDLSDDATGVGSRGDDEGAPVRTVVAATARVHRALIHHGFPCRVLDATEMAAFHVEADSLEVDRCGPIDHDDLTPELLERWWQVPAVSVTQVFSLRTGRSSRHPWSLSVTVGAESPSVPTPGAGSRRGRILPAPAETEAPVGSSASVRPDSDLLDSLSPPAHGTGQILGATDDGRAFAHLVAGPHLRTVVLAADRQVSRQVVLRAVASGLRLAVRTDAPEFWRPLVESVDDETRLRVDPADLPSPDSAADAVVWDRAEPLTPARIDSLARPGGRETVPPTVVQILSPDVDGTYAGVDEALATGPDLLLDGRIDGWLSVEPRGGRQTTVRVVAGPGEDELLSRPSTRHGELDRLVR